MIDFILGVVVIAPLLIYSIYSNSEERLILKTKINKDGNKYKIKLVKCRASTFSKSYYIVKIKDCNRLEEYKKYFDCVLNSWQENEDLYSNMIEKAIMFYESEKLNEKRKKITLQTDSKSKGIRWQVMLEMVIGIGISVIAFIILNIVIDRLLIKTSKEVTYNGEKYKVKIYEDIILVQKEGHFKFKKEYDIEYCQDNLSEDLYKRLVTNAIETYLEKDRVSQ